MTKIQHDHFLNTMYEVYTDVQLAGVLHPYAEIDSFPDGKIKVKDQKLFHFGKTASFVKRKLGALVREKYPCLQINGNFFLETFGIMEGPH